RGFEAHFGSLARPLTGFQPASGPEWTERKFTARRSFDIPRLADERAGEFHLPGRFFSSSPAGARYKLFSPSKTVQRMCSLLTADNASLPINCQIPLRGACAWRDPLTTSDHDVVAALGEDIARRIGEPRYKLWFAHKTKFSWQDDQLVVGVANHFVQEWL